MPRPRQTPRSLAALAVLALALSGCSSAELAAANGEPADDYGDGDGDPTGEAEETDTGDPTGAGDGDGDDDSTLPGPEDFGPEIAACEPGVAQVIAYGLEDAQAEAAATLVRDHVLHGPGTVPGIPLSAQPFLNHFRFNYPPVEGPEPQIAGELWKPPVINADAPPRYRLQFAIQGPQVLAEERGPVDLVIVVDLGPSMAGEPLGLAEEALAAIESALVPGDRVTLIGAAEEPKLLSSSVIVEGFGPSLLTGLLGGQSPAGVAKVGAALELAYETLMPSWEGQGQPRVLLVSNGHFQLDDGLVGLVEDHAVDGRYLVALGLGEPESFVEAPLRQLALEGRGSLLYDRTADDLWFDMQGRFAAHMLASATELELTLSLPPGLAIRDRDRLSPQANEPELALLGFNDAIVFHHELEACAELDPEALIRVELEWTDPATQEAKQIVWERALGDLGYGSSATRKGAATVAYVRALRGYRDGKPRDRRFAAVLDAISLITEALEGQPEDADLIEMSQVLGKLEG
ncbi:MAG: hypothetical protein R6X02_11705 [Enhygromyxa sp.]